MRLLQSFGLRNDRMIRCDKIAMLRSRRPLASEWLPNQLA